MNRRPHPWGLEVGVAVVALLYMLPLVFLGLISLKPKAEILRFDRILPVEWTWENYHRLFSNAEVIPIWAWLANSFLISLVVSVSALAAYAISRLRPDWGKGFLVVLAAAMMLPGQVLLVPMYLILNWLGWLDTPRALVIPAAAGAFGVFLLTRFFRSLPDDLEAAAEIDGCGPWGKFVHVALPHARSALVALGIITFIGTWNDFLGPLVFLDSIQKYTLPVGLALFQSSYANDYGLLFAASVVSSLPLLVV
ncbi:MAG: carbohydrate ABC transporter permease, partial [Betaproteobacteria bacterium]|nr:carbohydrate ABC transporter permease [Betaproteobacteria bacterium]